MSDININYTLVFILYPIIYLSLIWVCYFEKQKNPFILGNLMFLAVFIINIIIALLMIWV